MLSAVASDPPADRPPDAPPNADLLLYLGEFEDATGEFVDPMSLETSRELAPNESPATPQPAEDDDRDEPAPRSA